MTQLQRCTEQFISVKEINWLQINAKKYGFDDLTLSASSTPLPSRHTIILSLLHIQIGRSVSVGGRAPSPRPWIPFFFFFVFDSLHSSILLGIQTFCHLSLSLSFFFFWWQHFMLSQTFYFY